MVSSIYRTRVRIVDGVSSVIVVRRQRCVLLERMTWCRNVVFVIVVDMVDKTSIVRSFHGGVRGRKC